MLFIDTVPSVYNRRVLVSLSRLLKPDYSERLLVRSSTGQKPKTIQHVALQSREDVLTQHTTRVLFDDVKDRPYNPFFFDR